MYTIRIKLSSQTVSELVVDYGNVFDILEILETSHQVYAYQIWKSGIGICSQEYFKEYNKINKISGYKKWVDGSLFT